MDSNKKQKNELEVEDKISRIASTMRDMNKSDIPADVLGSYTGTSRDGEKPDQDGDDI